MAKIEKPIAPPKYSEVRNHTSLHIRARTISRCAGSTAPDCAALSILSFLAANAVQRPAATRELMHDHHSPGERAGLPGRAYMVVKTFTLFERKIAATNTTKLPGIRMPVRTMARLAGFVSKFSAIGSPKAPQSSSASGASPNLSSAASNASRATLRSSTLRISARRRARLVQLDLNSTSNSLA
jgi:hypothetical protein